MCKKIQYGNCISMEAQLCAKNIDAKMLPLMFVTINCVGVQLALAFIKLVGRQASCTKDCPTMHHYQSQDQHLP